jgi:hypothetical protein
VNCLRCLFPLFVLLLAPGCDDSHSPATRAADGFFPAAPGTRWTYDVSRQIPGSDSIPASTLTITVLDTRHVSGGVIASTWRIECPDTLARLLLFGTGWGDSAVVREDRDSVWISPAGSDTIVSYLLRPPLAGGKSWEWGGGWGGCFATVDSAADLNVPAGSFDSCSRVFSSGGWWQAPEDRYYWFRPSVGLVEGEFVQAGLINIRVMFILKGFSAPGTD